MKLNRSLILASASPRRSQLLQALDLEFTVKATDVEEIIPKDLEQKKVAEYLAILKGEATINWLNDSNLVLTADSIVLIDQEILGKPKDLTEAKAFLHKMSGRIHQVITGYCLLFKNAQNELQKVSKSVITEVSLSPLTQDEISYYVEKYPPLDRAGAYGIQDWIGWAKVNKINGSYSNVMGLPTAEILASLKELKFLQ